MSQGWAGVGSLASRHRNLGPSSGPGRPTGQLALVPEDPATPHGRLPEPGPRPSSGSQTEVTELQPKDMELA